MRLFEISWEVCNKVGGIYTVISSKADYIQKSIGEYYFIGPYFKEKRNPEFEEEEIPKEFKKTFELLKSKKIFFHFGIWKKTGIKTFLIDFSEFMEEKNEIKRKLWEDYQIDSLHSDFWFDEPIVWSYAVGILLESLCKKDEENVAHFHEWLCGAGLLYLKKNNVKIGKVFTTHATVVGRAMAALGEIYKGNNGDEEAYKLNVIDKHLIEKKAALNADIFTTVSDLTAEECEKIIGKKPQVIINGLDLKIMPTSEETSEKHRRNKEKIKELVMANFFPYYPFDIENTLFYYISGRYEIYSKGIDTYINALGSLNKKLILENSKRNVIAFLLIPSNVQEVNIKLLKNMMLLKEIKETISDFSETVKKRILLSLFSKEEKEINEKETLSESKKLAAEFIKKGTPEITTHYLKQDNDQILKMIKEAGLENKKEDRVKILFYPEYLNESDGVLNTDYYDVVSGFHLGIFPSFYEPWGYTPLESAALGVPTITTDLSGFGRFTLENKKEKGGIKVLKREGKTNQEITKDLEEEMYSYLHLDKLQRIKNEVIAQEFVHQICWDVIVKDYAKAYEQSLKNLAVTYL
jgi:glycogen(starch) synthase